MKVSALVPLLAASAALARPARRAPGLLAARQAHVQRDLLDVCAALDVDLVVAPLGGTCSRSLASRRVC